MHIALQSIAELFVRVFENSSIHGFPYIGRRDLHLVEKLFWIFTLSIGFACAYFAFFGQLKRYEENPTVLSVDVVSFSEFSKPSFTVCSTNHTDRGKRSELVERIFGSGSKHYNDYGMLIETIARTNYTNLKELRPFENLPNVSRINFLEVASEMHRYYPSVNPTFVRVMTELNMCQSSSDYYHYQMPENVLLQSKQNMTKMREEKCLSLEVCRISVVPNNMDAFDVNRIYINSLDEVMSGDDFDYVELAGSSIQERSIKVDEIKADPNIRSFKPRSRKCKFREEFSSKYYDVYTLNLCKMDCRINRARDLCGCVPFFYTVKNVKFCDLKGLLCLADKPQWYNATSCNCMKLCETTILTKLSSKDQNLMFDRMLTIDMIFPKTRIQRSVLFDFDDLLGETFSGIQLPSNVKLISVGLGGSLALFLGLSFLCSIEVLYYSIEYCMDIIINCIKS